MLIIILMILFLLLTAGVYFFNIPLNLVSNLTTILGCFGVFITTYFTARILNQKGIFIGLICGLTISLIVFTVSFLTSNVAYDSNRTIKIVALFFSACLGGILGGRLK